MKYVDANGNAVWNAGESVFYDVLNLGTFVSGDTLLAGQVPGLFDGIATINPVHTINNSAGFIDYAIVDGDTGNPTVSGVGVILRITFNVVSASGSSTIRINLGSSLSNPGAVSYQPIDGYFSNAPAYNYMATINQPTVTVVRLVSGTNDTLPAATVNLNWIVGTTRTVTVKVLGLPTNTVSVLNSTAQNSITCTVDSTHTPCHFTLTLRANGGPAGGASTSASGTYPLAVISNTTIAPTYLIREAWTTLIIKPPHPPTFNVTPTFVSFTQEAGSNTLIPVTVALTCSAPTQCANDSISLTSNVAARAGGSAFTFSPSSGKFPLSSTMNVSTPAILTPAVYTFNITGTTTGTYSEVSVTNFRTMTMTVLRTHDLGVNAEAISKTFAYVGVSLSTSPIKVNGTIQNHGTVSETFNANVTAKVALAVDPLIKGVNYHGNFFTAGDPVLYDTNGNNIADAGDIPITNGTTFKTDAHIKYLDANNNNVWNSSPLEAVIYEADNYATYNAGDTVITGNAPALNAALKTDLLLKYVDFNGNNVRDNGEAIVYDSIINNNHYDIGEYLVSPNLGANLSSDLNIKLRFVDSNYTGKLVKSESVVQDADNDGVYDNGELVLSTPIPSGGNLLASQNGITLAPGASTIVTFNIDPASLPLPRGTYVIYVYAARVTGEFRLDNNQVGIVPFTQRFKGDVSGDCRVDIVDLATVGAQFGKTSTTPGFNAAADLNNDGTINIVDLVLVAGNFGQFC